ncbi:MAG: SAVED domain-containing protein [Myxococcota bacterium]|nr:SAVED domain-containing protein [Myxococcota bacterium]
MAKNRDGHEFSGPVKRTLERRVACVCSKPGCGRITVGPHTESGKATSVGNAGHITSAAEGGPRYDPSWTTEQRRSIDNGIWLCADCHVIVDSNASPFGVELLKKWKRDAEARAWEALELGRKRDHIPRVVAALHRSMELIPDGSLARSLPLLLRHVANQEVVIDTRGLIGPDGPTDVDALAALQLGARDEIWQLLGLHPGAELAYYGIAHVPLAIHMGLLLGTRCSVQYAERDRDGSGWHWITEGDDHFPPLERRPHAELRGEDIAVSVSVSYPVTTAQIVASVGEMPVLALSVPSPSLDLVRTTKQVEAYSSVFRSVLEELTRSPSIKRIHLFAATPMAISFALGRQIRQTVHPEVHAYNYFRSGPRPYPWGLRLRDLSLSPVRVPS